jgi:hypothetical protein
LSPLSINSIIITILCPIKPIGQLYPTRNIAYKRGNIIKVEFGFNIGSEYGGLHYAIVLDKQSAHNSPVVTVIPLTSIKEDKEIHSNNINLGNEIYRSLKVKFESLEKKTTEEEKDMSDSIKQCEVVVTSMSELLKEYTVKIQNHEILNDEAKKKLDEWTSIIKKMQRENEARVKKLHAIQEEEQYLQKIHKEMLGMKEGSIALVSQITTISKIRISDPRNTRDVLSGISISKEGMDKINNKIKDLYVF